MQFPLTEDMFLAQDPTRDIDWEFLRAFIGAVNSWYEGGKKADHSRFYMTADIVKTVYKRFYNEEPEGEGIIMFFDVTADYMNAAWQQGLKDSGKVFDMPLEAIQVYPCFTETPPNPLKMERKAYYFEETGHFHSDIVLDEDNNLIDGYTSYLLAKQQGIRSVPVRYGKRQIIRAYHKQGGNLYEWELPEQLIDHVSAGDKVIVHTRHGVRRAIVAAVEPYKPHEHIKALRKVVRVKEATR